MGLYSLVRCLNRYLYRYEKGMRPEEGSKEARLDLRAQRRKDDDDARRKKPPTKSKYT